MKKHMHISKSLDNIENKFPSHLITFRNNNFYRNLPVFSKLNKNNHSSSSSFLLYNDKKNDFNFNQFPPTNFLEEMYLKYSKNLQKYFLKNQTGLKLVGNKYFKNLTVEDYMKQNNLTQEDFILLLNQNRPPHPNPNFENEISKENFFLTPMPNKSRQLLKTNKEKNDFLEAERSAVVMRTFEYTRRIKSKVGINELKKIMDEQKQKMIILMLASASKIQRWWKKKSTVLNSNKNSENYNYKIKYYNFMLNQKKAKYFLDKITPIIKKKKKKKFNIFKKKLIIKAKIGNKKFFSIFNWFNNMKICSQIKFNLLPNKYRFIKNKNLFLKNKNFITKISYHSLENYQVNPNSELYQIKKIIFLQKKFKQYLYMKKEKQNLNKKIRTNSQFSYYSPNKMIFLFNKSLNSDRNDIKDIKSIRKINSNYFNKNKNFEYEQINKKENLSMLSPITKNAQNYDDIDNDNINNDKDDKLNNIRNNKDINLIKSNTNGNYYNIEVRNNMNELKNKIKSLNNKGKSYNSQNNNKQIKKISKNTQKTKKDNIISKNQKNLFPSSTSSQYNPQNIKKSIKNNLLKIEEKKLNLLPTNNNNYNLYSTNNNNNNNLILMDSLEIDDAKKLDKKLISAINSKNEENNENLEKSLPPEINYDNYQQDSTLDFRDKRIIKSNQKTISTSAILHLDTSDNHIFLNNQIHHEPPYPLQIFGQICLNYIRRPLINKNNYYINKISKKNFSSEIVISLKKILKIKKAFLSNKFLSLSYHKFFILKYFLKKWKKITNKTAPPYTYTKTITSISTVENIEKNNYFSYYCKINKSSEENDFLFLRICLGYKLVKKIMGENHMKKFVYLLKKNRRRNYRAKTFNYSSYYNKNILNLFEFKIKLILVLNKILRKKYFDIFFHNFLIFSMNLEKIDDFNMNNKLCKLINEGYRKGYFLILYNIMNIKFGKEYYNTGLKFGKFINDLLRLNLKLK